MVIGAVTNEMKVGSGTQTGIDMRFSVLMSLYIKEKAEYARTCFESLERQTVCADEWVVIEDGMLNSELYALLDEWQEKNPNLIKRIKLRTNRGLGEALKEGVKHCSNELIARMDTDDICREDRFEKQLAEFRLDPGLDICGSHILEFDGNHRNIVCQRKVPLDNEDIVKYQKRRDGFNHVSVMFKKSAVLRAGNYQSCPLMEDTLLWAKMFLSGAKGKNIDDFLVYVRVGSDMFNRRGGMQYFKKYRDARRKVYETGFISRVDYVYTLAIQLIIALMPNKLRGFIYKKILHR